MQRIRTMALLLGIAATGEALAQEAASPAEVVAKVREAAALLGLQGAAGLATLQNRDGPFVFKDSYVFASDCGSGILLAHPVQPERNGQPIAAGAGLWWRHRRRPGEGAMRRRDHAGRRVVRLSLPQAGCRRAVAQGELSPAGAGDDLDRGCGRA